MSSPTFDRALRQTVQELPEVNPKNGLATGAPASDFWSYEVAARGELLPAPYTRMGERMLRAYDRHNYITLWHGTKSGLIKKIGATPWQIKGGRNLTAYFDDILRYSQWGASLEQVLELLANDYMVFNGGAYLEIIAPGSPLRAPTGRVTGLAHLDSYACLPTGNPEYPVLYTDRKGGLHLMHHTRVVHLVDTPDGDQLHPGYGRSALWRAIAIVQRQILMNRYVVGKLDDKPPPGMMTVGGMTRAQWQAAWSQYRLEQQNDEMPDWGKVIALFGADASLTPEITPVAFSAAPENWDYKEYVELDVHEFALAVGVDIQELWELTGGNLGSGQQSQVQHAKSQGKTYGEFLATFERAMNNYVLPDSLEFQFKVRDPYEAQERAQNAQVWITGVTGAMAQGVLTVNEGRELLATQIEPIGDVIKNADGSIIRLPDFDRLSPQQQLLDITAEDGTPLSMDGTPAQSGTLPLQLVKDFDATSADFASTFSDLVGAAQDGDLNRRRAGTVLRANLNRLGRAAYMDGLKAGGVEDMSEADLNAVAVLTAEQSGYVTAFLDSLKDAPLNGAQVTEHASMWVNKSLTPFYDAGRLSADANGVYEWVLGVAEHCPDCKRMAGQKHRLREYAAKGITPKASRLECGGYNCKCTLVRTSGKARGGWLG